MDNVSSPDRFDPLYARVFERMKKLLLRGEFKPGDTFPTEQELTATFGVSVGTIRKAVLMLVDEGLLSRKAGRGTFVTGIESWRSYERFFGFKQAQEDAEAPPKIEVIGKEVTTRVSALVSETLNLEQGDEVFHLKRVLKDGDVPVCTYDSYIPYALVRGVEKEDLTQKLYPLLARKFGAYAVDAEEFLSAGGAEAEVARVLEVKVGEPLIVIERTVLTYGGAVLEHRVTFGRSDRFRFRMQLRRPASP